MTLYEQFNIPQYWNREVRIVTDDIVYEGTMYDLVSDDDEPETVAIQIDEYLTEILLSEVESIELLS